MGLGNLRDAERDKDDTDEVVGVQSVVRAGVAAVDVVSQCSFASCNEVVRLGNANSVPSFDLVGS